MATIADTLAQAWQLQQAGNLTHAEWLYRQALAADPTSHEAWRKLGQCLQTAGRLPDAIVCFQQVLLLQPNDLPACLGLGSAQTQSGQLEAAAVTFQALLSRDPLNIDATNNLGFVLAMLGRSQESAAVFQQAIRVYPNNAAFHSNLGNVLAALGRDDEAAACHRRSLELNPHAAATHNNLGTVLFNQDKLDAAMRCYEQAVKLLPDYAEAHNNMGTILERRGQFQEAIARYHHALKLKPHYAEAFSNLGNAWSHSGHHGEALACYEQALRLDPANADAHLNKALQLLLQGDWLAAWPEYEWRWRTKGFVRYTFSQPRWDGTSLPGKTLLVLAEQGLGDTLQFMRYFALVKQRVGKVVFNCHPQLVKLVANVAGIDQIVPMETPLPPFDAYIPLLSLPGIYRTTPETAPATIPYLHPEAELAAFWKSELKLPAGLNVGIAWQGNPKYRYDRLRSMPLAQFGRLAAVPGVRLVSLQKGLGTEQLRAVTFPVHDVEQRLGDDLDSFRHLAAIVKNLDLVIACDTAVVHLAGALGIAAWVGLPWDSDWRWLLRREDSHWYPKVRLFRQLRVGEWDEVFQRMAQELRLLQSRE